VQHGRTCLLLSTDDVTRLLDTGVGDVALSKAAPQTATTASAKSCGPLATFDATTSIVHVPFLALATSTSSTLLLVSIERLAVAVVRWLPT
jgi:hypothetical protein